MNIKEIKELKIAIVELHAFCNGGAIRTKKGDIDKYGTRFTANGSRKMSGSHSVCYDTHYGYYGNSDAYPQIELPQSTHGIFWECFDEYLNEHQDQILNAVCQKMQLRLSKETTTVQEEINRLTTLMNDLDAIKAQEGGER